MKPADTEISQIAVIVDDIEAALDAYCRVFDIDERPKISETADAATTQIEHRGATTPARARLAFLRFANITLELIEPLGRPSVWGEVLDDKGTVGHHLGIRVQGMQQVVDDFAGRGAPLVQRGEYTGGRYAYLDTRGELGLDLELLEND